MDGDVSTVASIRVFAFAWIRSLSQMRNLQCCYREITNGKETEVCNRNILKVQMVVFRVVTPCNLVAR